MSPGKAPVYLPEMSMQSASAYATNSQPLERSVYTHQQHQIMIDEFPETPGQPECSSFLTGNCISGPACRFHHPKNRSAKSTSSGLNESCLPLRHVSLSYSFIVSHIIFCHFMLKWCRCYLIMCWSNTGLFQGKTACFGPSLFVYCLQ